MFCSREEGEIAGEEGRGENWKLRGEQGSKVKKVRIETANIPFHISKNPHLATNMRRLVGFAPRPNCVDTVSAGIEHLCKGTHLVVISGVQSR